MSSSIATLPSNSSAPIQEAMLNLTSTAASVLYVLLLLPALARNQSIGYAPPYLPYSPGYTGASYGYPALGAAFPGAPGLYAPAGSVASTPPFAASSQQVQGGLSGFGFPSGWPARPLGPIAAALATAYPTLFAALTGPCRSWCRAPSLPFFFPPRYAVGAPGARGFLHRLRWLVAGDRALYRKAGHHLLASLL